MAQAEQMLEVEGDEHVMVKRAVTAIRNSVTQASEHHEMDEKMLQT